MSKFTEYLEGNSKIKSIKNNSWITKEETEELKKLLNSYGFTRLKDVVKSNDKNFYDSFFGFKSTFFGMDIEINFKTKEIIPIFLGESLGTISVNINKNLQNQLIELFKNLQSLKYFKLSTKKELPSD